LAVGTKCFFHWQCYNAVNEPALYANTRPLRSAPFTGSPG
jgi:hypothetical protein